MSGDLSGRVALVTGAGQGIGRVLARGLAGAGAAVGLADIGADAAGRVAAKIAAEAGQALALPHDIRDPAAVTDAMARLGGHFGAPLILVNSARWTGLAPTPVHEISDADRAQAMEVNVTGAFHCVRATVPGMIAAGWGRIVTLSSSTARLPPHRPYAHYITTKAALIGLTRALARELGPHGISANALLPGAVETEIARHPGTEERAARARAIQSVPRVTRPEDLVAAMLFLAGEGSAMVTGRSLAVDGGLTFG